MSARCALAIAAVLCACGSSSGDATGSNGGTGNDAGNVVHDAGTTADAGSGGYLIGGRILTAGASGLVLQTPGEPQLTIAQSYPPGFAFANRVPTGTAYDVTIASQPPTPGCGGICTCTILDGGVGTVGTTDVTDVLVSCAIQLP
jgi:hypothetical protein